MEQYNEDDNEAMAIGEQRDSPNWRKHASTQWVIMVEHVGGINVKKNVIKKIFKVEKCLMMPFEARSSIYSWSYRVTMMEWSRLSQSSEWSG